MKNKHIAAHCRVDRPGTFRMKNCQSGDTFGISDRAEIDAQAEKNVETLSQFQEKLYAQSEWSVLLILQAMDAAGKDSTIKHVLTGVKPSRYRTGSQPSGSTTNCFRMPSTTTPSPSPRWLKDCRQTTSRLWGGETVCVTHGSKRSGKQNDSMAHTLVSPRY